MSPERRKEQRTGTYVYGMPLPKDRFLYRMWLDPLKFVLAPRIPMRKKTVILLRSVRGKVITQTTEWGGDKPGVVAHCETDATICAWLC